MINVIIISINTEQIFKIKTKYYSIMMKCILYIYLLIQINTVRTVIDIHIFIIIN
jgi:hypothetical protein